MTFGLLVFLIGSPTFGLLAFYIDWESDIRTPSLADSESDFRTPNFSDIGSPTFGLLDTAIIIIPVVVSFNYTAMIWIDLGRALKDLFLSQIEFYLTFMEFHGIILLNRALFHYI